MLISIIFLIVCIILAIYGPQIKGYFGEQAMISILNSLPIEEYQVINNVLLTNNYGTTQIDHIVVSVYGIYVIETKNYKGWITGGEFSEQWTKNMYGNKYKFRNPIKQNYAHVKALMHTTDINNASLFIPIVAFAGASNLKVTVNSIVIYINQVKDVIESFKEVKLSRSQMLYIADKIRSSNIDSKDARKAHVASINNLIYTSKQAMQYNICPKCGGHMTLRNGKYGAFKGCSNYPRCKFTSK